MGDTSRRRFKRLRATTQAQDVPHEPSTSESVATALNVNTSGLSVFPDELLLEILSYYPGASGTNLQSDCIDVNARVARREALDSLSQTCRNLRKFFRPYIWECIEVCSGMQVGDTVLEGGTTRRDRNFALELLRQLEIVTIRDPSLAEYVKIVNVEVKDYSPRGVLAELARCLALFSNLHTVKLKLADGSETNRGASDAFRQHLYPQIRFLIISQQGLSLLKSCPGVRVVRPLAMNSWMPQAFLDTMVEHCHCVEKLPISISCGMIERLPTIFPCLKELSINTTHLFSDVKHATALSMLKDLRIIRVNGSMYSQPRVAWAKALVHELRLLVKEKNYAFIQQSANASFHWAESAIIIQAHEPS
ncbi:hypothetical protein BDZ97DRAFT_1916239 [Flammula alnicola]|nr:hypothetical protein BDZ97DRAFT_1916239 [Flammula alnicola]